MFPRQHKKEDWTCVDMYAYDAVRLLPKAISLAENAPEDSSLNSTVKSLAEIEVFSDIDFILDLLDKTQLKYKNNKVNLDKDLTDIFQVIEVLIWIIECNYVKALNREWIELPDIIRNADKILKQVTRQSKESSAVEPIAPHMETNGVPPPNIPPWIFTVCATIDKEKRIDWELFHKLKTEYTLSHFIDLYEMVESAKSYETAELINSL